MVAKAFRSFLKLVLYLIFLAGAIIYTPKVLSKVLDTTYPLATVTSGSMWPVLKVNDLILVKGLKGQEAEIGQIIIFSNQEGFTIHRLIRKENNMLVTKGDANNVEDRPINPDQVLGSVVYIKNKIVRIPYLGLIARNMGPKIGKLQKK